MVAPIILASGSHVRGELLRNTAVSFRIDVPRIDEETLKDSLLAMETKPRDIADALAEAKARKISQKNPDALVIGCDQVLDFDGALLSKPKTPQDAIDQLTRMSGQRHALFSAAVIYQDGQPLWRHIGHVRMRMRQASAAYIADYVERNWDDIRHCVGAYKLEGEGIRLMHHIDGDYFHVLGMPLLEILAYLVLRGDIDG